MTNQERMAILIAAVEKAVAFGLDDRGVLEILKTAKISEKDTLGVEGIIYNHDFAKALWGDKGVNVPANTGFHRYVKQTAWRARLQQMVVADDPVKYLGEHI